MLHILLPPTLVGKIGQVAKTAESQPTVADIWIWAIIVLAGLFAIAVITALLVNYRPGGADKTTRRTWFWILAILTPIASFLLNYFVHIKDFEAIFRTLSPTKITETVKALTMNNVYSCIAVFAAFILIGFVLSKVFKRSKLGTWF